MELVNTEAKEDKKHTHCCYVCPLCGYPTRESEKMQCNYYCATIDDPKTIQEWCKVISIEVLER